MVLPFDGTAKKSELEQMGIQLEPSFYADNATSSMIKEAIDFLLVANNRKAYKRYVQHEKGFFSRARYQAIKPQECYEWLMLIVQITISLLFVVLGIWTGIQHSDETASRLMITGIVSGSFIGAGIISIFYFMHVEAVVEKCKMRFPLTSGYSKKVLAGVLGGSVAGAVSVVIVDLVVGHPHPAHVPLGSHVLEGCLAMAVDAFMYALADGVVTGTYIYSGKGGVLVELCVALISGSIAGSLGGLVVHHVDLFVEVTAAFLRPIWPTISRIVLRSTKVCVEHSFEKTGVQMLHCCVEAHERHHHKRLYRQESNRVTQEYEQIKKSYQSASKITDSKDGQYCYVVNNETEEFFNNKLSEDERATNLSDRNDS